MPSKKKMLELAFIYGSEKNAANKGHSMVIDKKFRA